MSKIETSQSPDNKSRRALLFIGAKESVQLLPSSVLAIPRTLESIGLAPERLSGSADYVNCTEGIIVYAPKQEKQIPPDLYGRKNANYGNEELPPPTEKEISEGVSLLADGIIDDYKKRNPEKYDDLRLDRIYGRSGFTRSELFGFDYRDESKLRKWGIFVLKYGGEASVEKSLVLFNQNGSISTLRSVEGLSSEIMVLDNIFVSPEVVLISYLNSENRGIHHFLYDVREYSGG